MNKVLWLCKSRYMGHDVIEDRYARLFEIPTCLGRYAQVRGFCLDYRLAKAAAIPADLAPAWARANIPRTLFVGWFIQLLAYTRRFRPQAVVASSDCLHVILGALLARVFGARFYADLYDDYATFGLARVPGMRWLYRRALARADGICSVSRTLGQDVQQSYPGVPVLVLESTIDAGMFRPLDKAESRQRIGLDDVGAAKLVGICGGLNPFHGADIVFGAFAEIAAGNPDVLFVIAGQPHPDCPIPERDDVRFIGRLPHADMPSFFSAMDLVVVPLSNTRFGYFAFPQKAYEVLACRTPAVAAEVGSLALLFESLPDVRYDPDSSSALAVAALRQLDKPRLLEVDIPTWEDQAKKLAEFIR